MNNETQDIIQMVSTLILIIAFFAVALIGARWSRRKNRIINLRKVRYSHEQAIEIARKEGKDPRTKVEFWAGDVSLGKELLGRGLAIFAIAIFLTFLIFAGFIVVKII